jgi:hypothetical protein
MINNSVGRVNELLNSKVHHNSHIESCEGLRNSVHSTENYFLRDRNEIATQEDIRVTPV